jgi:cytochrome bd ubiquinol oxidase subunit II
MNTVWFIVLAALLAGYAVLDGFDLGVGIVHFALGRSTRERGMLIDTIGPVWNGNEVWLLAAGGAMFVAFPHVYAASFSGFYLALMLVLWLLLLRGLGIEFRHQIDNDLWKHAWDVVFSLASGVLAILFGVALANVLRGVPLDQTGEFRGTFTLLLNPFAILGGLLSLATLAQHGAAWVALKTEGEVQARARRFAGRLWFMSTALLAAVVVASFAVRPDFTRNFLMRPWLGILPLIAAAAVVLVPMYQARRDDRRAFAAGGVMIASTVASVAAGLFPLLLPASRGSAHPGLDIYNSAAATGSLRVALGVYLFGMTLIGVYMINIYRIWRGKVQHVYH